MGGISLTGEPDFMIHGVYQFTLFGQELWITTTTIGLLIISLFILILAIIANRHLRKASEVPDTIQNIVELAAEMLEKMIGSVMGKNGEDFSIILERFSCLSCSAILADCLGFVPLQPILA